MALKSKPWTLSSYDPSDSPQTRQFKDWVVGALNSMIGQSIPEGAGSQFLDPNTIDPSGEQVIAKGGRTQSLSTPMVYVAQPTQIGFYWDGTNGSSPLAIYKDDGSIISPIVGNLVVDGLTASTLYFFYPYYDETLAAIQFSTTTSGAGIPRVAFANGSMLAAQQQFLSNRIPLSYNFSTTGITTPSSGSASGNGGTGGGSGAGAAGYTIPNNWKAHL